MDLLKLESLILYLIVPNDQTVYSSSEQNREIIELEDNRTAEEILESLLNQLACKKYDELRSLIISATDDAIAKIHSKLFRAVIEEYDEDFIENGFSDAMLENVLILLKSYGTINDKLTVLLECSSCVNSWKAFMLLGSFVEEIMPEINDLSDHFIYDVTKVYISSWIERFEKNVTLNHSNEQLNRKYLTTLEADYLGENYRAVSPGTSSDLFLAAVFMFLRLFALSRSTNYELLIDLYHKVLACTYIPSKYMEEFVVKLDELYKFSGRQLPLNTLMLANSLKSNFHSIPRVFAPEYYLKYILGPLHHSLHISTSNMFNIGYVVLVLRNCLSTIEDESINRNEWTFFLEFLGDFLICCEENALCEMRVTCMNTFKMFLLKFEPVAQVLIIRKLFNMVRSDEIKRKNLHRINSNDEKSLKCEAQFLAWFIDLFRFKLKYEVFRRELGFFWGDIVSTRYSYLSDGLQFYLSAFILAQEHALHKMNPALVLNIYKCYLQPLKSQISDWTELVEVEAQHIRRENQQFSTNQLPISVDRLEMEARRQQDVQSLPLLQFEYLQTLNFVEDFLHNANMLHDE